jgi:hypothetical protein
MEVVAAVPLAAPFTARIWDLSVRCLFIPKIGSILADLVVWEWRGTRNKHTFIVRVLDVIEFAKH